MKFFKYYFKKKKKKEKEEYYSQFINEESLSAVFNLFTTADQFFKTKTPIGLPELPFGSSRLEVRFKKGRPAYKKAKKYNKIHHEVRAYITNLYKSSLQTNLHFINHKLLYAHYCFLYADIELQKMVYQLVEEKYQCDASSYPELGIKDSLDNCIKLNGGIHLNLYYLSGNKNYLQLLKDELDRNEFLKEKNYLNRRNCIGKLI